jgi:nuclear transport factor 2 (NTF2) superfamily protein
MPARPPLPRFTRDAAIHKVRLAEDACKFSTSRMIFSITSF